jgi:hypothetical protein
VAQKGQQEIETNKWKFNDIISADEKKQNITVEPLFRSCKKTIYLFIDRRLRSYTCFERNNAGLKKLSQVLSEQTSDSSAFLNAMCL